MAVAETFTGLTVSKESSEEPEGKAKVGITLHFFTCSPHTPHLTSPAR